MNVDWNRYNYNAKKLKKENILCEGLTNIFIYQVAQSF